MQKLAVESNDVPLVTIMEVAGRIGVTPEHVISWAGPDNIVTNWGGSPAVTTAIAKKVVEEFRKQEGDRARVARDATIAHERRREALAARVSEIIAEGESAIHNDPASYNYNLIIANQPAGQRMGLTKYAAEKLAEMRRDAVVRAEREIDG